MIISQIVDMLTGVFEAIAIVMLIDAYSDSSVNLSELKNVLSALVLTVIINLSNEIADREFLNLVLITLSIFFVSFVYNKSIKANIIVSLAAVLILTISEIVVLFLITLFMKLSVEDAINIESYRILGIVVSKLFSFIIFKVICIKHGKNNNVAVKNTYWMLFFSIAVTSMAAIFLIFRLQYESQSINLYNMSAFCSIGLLYSTFFTLYLYERMIKKADAERREELFQQQMKSQAKHLDEILLSQKQIKSFRHDLSNHMISLKAYFENRDCEEGMKYLQTMTNSNAYMNDIIDTGNIALDAIINTKKNIAESKDIEFITIIQIPEDIFIDAIDICIIFGNALDNAIEACEYVKYAKKQIKLSIVYDDHSIICKIVNTCIKSDTLSLITNKADRLNHGFGIQNIKSSLDHYNNIFKFSRTDNEFILSFIIFEN